MKFTILAISKCPIQWYIHHVSQTSPPHISRTLCHGRRKLISTRNLFSFLPPLASGDLSSHLSVSDFFVLYAIHKQCSIACDHCEWLFFTQLSVSKVHSYFSYTSHTSWQKFSIVWLYHIVFIRPSLALTQDRHLDCFYF